ncbi:lipid IV(A) 3-deoxy-D-manno-octulosonic acid transferase [Marichromatium sp. AB32]|uniref:lipid IV(A) 3-deoxy-D-manno-octulosonic acid transferase n=1 Tax=Marichromatium sp. AB32 TaxID=2483363 RepID=UPI000F3B8724|nr:lipid IV(A) 3-deoxy-D-manno-octulosonic acid transferase [Marichromatium sp. AB32]RNE90905.1 3-deoxy-D-manno-octulosonic acid transferase [Marichromatium sp. AB32]
MSESVIEDQPSFRGTLLQLLYTLVLRLTLPLVLLRLVLRGLSRPARELRLGERLARGVPAPPVEVWVHAVSVGEVLAARGLINHLLARTPTCRVLVTTTTPTGAERLHALFGERVAHRYTPYDLPGVQARFLDQARPRLLIVIETEIWPNMLDACAERGIPSLLVNARLSARSARGYAQLGRLTAPTLRRFALIAAQGRGDARRFNALGAEPERVRVTGSVKFDVADDPERETRSAELRAHWGEGRPLWIAASTHEGEEARVLAAHRRVLEHHPEALLVLVPRHPERFDQVAALVETHGFRLARRTDPDADVSEAQVLLGDTMGELAGLIAAVDVAFIGGSLVPVGGHNLLEAAVAGVPALVGPHTFNFAEITTRLIGLGGCARVADSEALAARLTDWLAAPERRAAIGANGRAFVEANRGALARLIGLVEGYLPKG